mmetsp:Transcript_5171/g.16315  ORF Transcript_5171/g.16315 Transcript_5171/m.16315 type:complete len:224 (-) Transcript_5171:192-863(-)
MGVGRAPLIQLLRRRLGVQRRLEPGFVVLFRQRHDAEDDENAVDEDCQEDGDADPRGDSDRRVDAAVAIRVGTTATRLNRPQRKTPTDADQERRESEQFLDARDGFLPLIQLALVRADVAVHMREKVLVKSDRVGKKLRRHGGDAEDREDDEIGPRRRQRGAVLAFEQGRDDEERAYLHRRVDEHQHDLAAERHLLRRPAEQQTHGVALLSRRADTHGLPTGD